ncbi:MAG: hypothetical protein H6701_08545 [Myxococcales bacterium]|nr:hypothetical protein [Myxococcales bacterium]
MNKPTTAAGYETGLAHEAKRMCLHALDAVITRFAPLAADPEARQALDILREDFETPDHVGPRRAAEFRFGRPDPNTQADAFGYVQAFLAAVRPA